MPRRCLRPASFSIRMPEPPHKSPIAFRTRTPKVSLPGREPSHSADAVALLTQQSASSTLKARPAKLHHAAANVDREDNHAPGSVSSAEIICLTPQQRLDNSIRTGLMQRSKKDSYSITSSARSRSAGGRVTPIAFAVFKLTTSSNLVGCSTGISPGFFPRSILSTKSAARRNEFGKLGP